MSQIFTWIWVSSGILLILLVLLHSPKGDGMGGIAASGSSMFTSASSAEASLNKITWTILITADHGNAELMKGPDGEPWTAHTVNKVPLIFIEGEKRKIPNMGNEII